MPLLISSVLIFNSFFQLCQYSRIHREGSFHSQTACQFWHSINHPITGLRSSPVSLSPITQCAQTHWEWSGGQGAGWILIMVIPLKNNYILRVNLHLHHIKTGVSSPEDRGIHVPAVAKRSMQRCLKPVRWAASLPLGLTALHACHPSAWPAEHAWMPGAQRMRPIFTPCESPP